MKKALARMQAFYKKKALLQDGQDPMPPVEFKKQKENAGGSPVISMLKMIIEGSKAVEVDAPRMDTTKGPDVRHYEVVHHYKRAIELQPFDPGPRQRLGVYYSRQGRHQRAIVEYRACIKLTRGRHMPCWKNMALGLQAVHQPKLALEAYEKALQLGDKGEKTPQKMQELKAMLAGL